MGRGDQDIDRRGGTTLGEGQAGWSDGPPAEGRAGPPVAGRAGGGGNGHLGSSPLTSWAARGQTPVVLKHSAVVFVMAAPGNQYRT